MVNFFNKKQEENPISVMLSDLSENQKMSVVNLLLTIGVCDGDQGNQEKEIQFLNTYVSILDVRQDKCTPYLEAYGYTRIISDLKTISQRQKEFLIVSVWDMIICDGRPNDTELRVASDLFEQFGVPEDLFYDTIQKTQALMKHFFGK
jgi:uncharacterized tellurite resistance protein B-like protein